MRIYDQPLTGGSDEHLNELAHEWNEDPDYVPTHSVPEAVTRAELEATAALARQTVAADDADPAPRARLFPSVYQEKVLMDWWPL